MLKLRSMLYSLGTKAKTNIDYLGTTFKTNIDYLGTTFKTNIDYLGTTVKTNISSLLIFLFFSLFIVYMFYNRLIRERLPRNLSEPVSSLQEYIYMYILGVNIIILILLLWGRYQEYIDEAYEELGVEREVNKKSIWYRIKEKGAKYSSDVRYKIAQTYMGFIYPRWQDPYHKFLIACYIQFNDLSDRVKLIYFYGILIIPKVVVAGVFLWDIFIQNELNLFYRMVGLLLIPLLFRFICYNYWIIIHNAIDCIKGELDNDPHAFRGTREDIENIVANLNKEYYNSEAQEYVEQEKAAWYKRISPKLQEFLLDLQKKTGVALYAYNIRISIFLYYLTFTMENIDKMKKEIHFSLNIILRIIYVLGWIIIIKNIL